MPNGSFEVDRQTHNWSNNVDQVVAGLVQSGDRYRNSNASGGPHWYDVTAAMIGLDVIIDNQALLALDANVIIRRTES